MGHVGTQRLTDSREARRREGVRAIFLDDDFFDGGADLDIGYCSGCGADMRGEPPAAVRCSACAADDQA